MLQGYRSLLCILDIDFLLFDASDPLGKFEVVRHRCGEHYDTHCVRKFDNDFFPDTASLLVVNVVHLVEDDPFDISDAR